MTKQQAEAARRDHALLADLHEALDRGLGLRSSKIAPQLVDVFAAWLSTPKSPRSPKRRQFTGAHLRVVYLLAESQGSTHTRLRRSWDAKSARVGALAWPWISDSGLRTRVSELKSWGLVERSGAWGETVSGRRSAIWQLTGVVPAAVGRDADPVPGVARGTLSILHELVSEGDVDVTIRVQLELAASVAGVTA